VTSSILSSIRLRKDAFFVYVQSMGGAIVSGGGIIATISISATLWEWVG